MAERIRALIVDDEPLARERIRTLLTGEPEIEVVGECGDGHKAVAAIRRHAPDLLFLDVQMPKMNGFEVVEKLRAEESTATVPIIMLTGLSDRAKIQEALSSGIDFYIIKPFDFDELITKVREALESREL